MTTPRKAVVIGASIAGLAAAKALASRFDQVIVLERDALADDSAPRKGVPQGSQAHVLLTAGSESLDELFPGLMDEYAAAGAIRLDPVEHLELHSLGSVWSRQASGLDALSGTRPLLELLIRRRVLAEPNVEIRGGATVAGLTHQGDRVTGVVVDGETIESTLVVDCSGRGSRSDRWLGEMGFKAPEVVEIKVGVRYATRMYRRKTDPTVERSVLVLPTAPEKRCGLLVPMEDDQWCLLLGGWHGDAPGADEDEFLAHAKAMPHPRFLEVVEGCEPLTEIRPYAYPSSRRRLFENLGRVPAGYLALGDAVCSFNPVYGQGMTVAAMEAVALGRLLDSYPAVTAQLSRDYYQETKRIVTTPWQFAAGADLTWPETVGKRPLAGRVFNRYAQRILRASKADPDIRLTFTRVQHLLIPPTVFQRPGMVLRVLRASRKDVA